MATSSLSSGIQSFLHRIGRPPAGDCTEAKLLDRFAAGRDEAAFAALVQRHGPMVLGVCRRVLLDTHHAEDATQATFLILARKAATLDRNRSLGCWLYTVARNTALKARRQLARRRTQERRVMNMPSPNQSNWSEILPLLEAELGKLPEKYRAPLVLCYLEGKTHKQVSVELGWPAGSLAKRLARAQDLLRQRLVRRGIALSTGGLAAMLTGQSTAIETTLAARLSQAAICYAAGRPPAAGSISTAALALAAGGLQSLGTGKLKLALLTLLLGLMAGGAAIFWRTRPTDAQGPPDSSADAPRLVSRVLKVDPRQQAVEAKLAQKVRIKGIAPNTPVMDALNFLSDRYDLKFAVNSDAMAGRGIQKFLFQAIRLQPVKNVKLSSVLQMLLGNQYNLGNWSVGYHIRPDGVIEVAPNAVADLEEGPPEPRLLAALAQPISLTIQPKMCLANILEMLAKSPHLKDICLYVHVGEFRMVGIQQPVELPVKPRKWKNVPLGTVLRELLQDVDMEQLPNDAKLEPHVASYILREDYIEIVPVPAALLGKQPLPAKQVEQWRHELGSANPQSAFRAVRFLAEVPRQAVPLIKEKVKPVLGLAPADDRKVAKLVEDLESNQFAERQRATKALEQLGEAAEPTLWRALQNKPSLDLRQRLEKLLTRLDGKWLQTRRAIQVLQRIGNTESQQLLETLAKGDPHSRLTLRARSALRRLDKRR